MGIPCDDTAFVYGYNKLVLANTAVPASNLKNKMNSLSYHFVQKGCAWYECCTAYVNTNLNLDDLLTKLLPSGEKRWGFVRRFYIGFNSNKVFVGSGLGQVPDTTPCIWFRGFQICYWVKFFPGWKLFVGSGLRQVPDTTPCLWFWGFQIFYWVRFFREMKFIHLQWL